MRKIPFALVIPTIGITELFVALKSLEGKDPFPDQVIVVIDDKGHRLSNLSERFTIERLEEKILEILPSTEVYHNTHEEDWQMNNQTFNIGMSHVKHKYAYITHDDVYYPSNPAFFTCVERAIERLEKGEFPKKVVGATFPGFHKEIDITAPSHDGPGLTQYYSAVASLLSVDYWREIGEFDIEHGIWWDAQVQGELRKSDHWMLFQPAEAVTHFMNRALRANDHAKGWSHAPLWANCAAAYERVYGDNYVAWGEWYSRPDNLITLD